MVGMPATIRTHKGYIASSGAQPMPKTNPGGDLPPKTNPGGISRCDYVFALGGWVGLRLDLAFGTVF
jgi:hypothetical protein